ncbi:hypothetical protein GJ496_009743 [Pomphorhynchus laevis]|nr:hypothetical protein GJ496_009743 [Pomphorhynchus laevis]
MVTLQKNIRNESRFLICTALIAIIVGITWLCIYKLVHPFKNGYSCDDTSIMRDIRTETISEGLLVGITVLYVLISLIANEVIWWILDRKKELSGGRILFNRKIITRTYLFIEVIVVFTMGYLIEGIFVEVLKISVGALRPNYIQQCIPIFANESISNSCAIHASIYIGSNEYTCKNSKTIADYRKSFPSNHTGSMAYAVAFITIFLMYSQRKRNAFLSNICGIIGVILTFYIATSRLRDNMHHPRDLVGGIVIGVTVGMWFSLDFLKRYKKYVSVDFNENNFEINF